MHTFQLLTYGIIWILYCTGRSLGESYDEYCDRVLSVFRSSKNLSQFNALDHHDFLQFTLVEYFSAQEKSKQAKDDVKLMEIEANYADQSMQAATIEVMVASSRLQTAQEDVSYAASMLHSSRLQFIENDKMLMDARKKADVLSAMMRSAKSESVAQQISDDTFQNTSTENSRK